jgi:predicted O-methyltransferase YrrM
VSRVTPSPLRSLPLPRALRRFVTELVIADRERRGSDLAHVRRWPDRIAGFEDLTFLFTSTVLAHGVASLRLDEAAYLYRLVRDEQPRVVVEIGRFRGGSTILIASALESGVLHSYDIPTRQGREGAELDRQLAEALDRFGLADRVQLHVADSRTAAPPVTEIDILFVDGDHSEEGVRADVEHWAPLLRPDGHLLFHDAVAAPDFAPPNAAGPTRVAADVGTTFEARDGAGSLAHVVRRA